MICPPSRPALPLPPSAEGDMTRRAFEHLKSSCDAEALLRRAGLTLQGIEDPRARIGRRRPRFSARSARDPRRGCLAAILQRKLCAKRSRSQKGGDVHQRAQLNGPLRVVPASIFTK